MAVTNDPSYSDYESGDESDYGFSNSKIDIGDYKKKRFNDFTPLSFPTSNGIYCKLRSMLNKKKDNLTFICKFLHFKVWPAVCQVTGPCW